MKNSETKTFSLFYFSINFSKYTELTKLVSRNASNERIADRAFDFFSPALMDGSATEEQYNALYDLTLLEEPGMELNKDEIMALINSLK
ncbi:TPA: hypothetical protein ACJKC4_000345 [Neisseria meningitidis]|uniref:hypothetical protein n=1 Tax=Neisseria meningitidis TaxID=487 RepID=UPI0009A1E121|nr:hypothetical protein [Neisseria meningitidis]MCL4982481.1 hypothetical protein [Neisseria meningitidis]MCL4984479.1 hypothetical protein [Neisseria meningitidis]MCL4990604.1 hypothetical protein [Neisseria meningitidis]MCL4996870.1 hypothetical protein [Neisseria meningitidis]MCL5000761.1 hypothetical protein [Neisseria meningitidis]